MPSFFSLLLCFKVAQGRANVLIQLKGKENSFAQGLSGGKRCKRTPWGCLARKNGKIPEVAKVNNDQNFYWQPCEYPASSVFVFLYLQYCMSVNYYCQCRQLKWHLFKSRLNMYKVCFFFIITFETLTFEIVTDCHIWQFKFKLNTCLRYTHKRMQHNLNNDLGEI
jgi:hypothetical protein